MNQSTALLWMGPRHCPFCQEDRFGGPEYPLSEWQPFYRSRRPVFPFRRGVTYVTSNPFNHETQFSFWTTGKFQMPWKTSRRTLSDG